MAGQGVIFGSFADGLTKGLSIFSEQNNRQRLMELQERRMSMEEQRQADLTKQRQAEHQWATEDRARIAAALDAKSFGEFWENFKKAPLTFIANVGVESLPAMAPGLAVGVPAGVVAGPAGFALGMGAGSYGVDYQSAVLEALGEMGVDVTDRSALEGAFSNPETMEQVRRLAHSHAAVVGAADAASGGVAGKALVRGGSAAARAGNMGAQMGAGAALGMAGEAGGQVAQGKTDLAVGQILAEGLGEMSMAPVEVAGAAFSRGREQSATATGEDADAPSGAVAPLALPAPAQLALPAPSPAMNEEGAAASAGQGEQPLAAEGGAPDVNSAASPEAAGSVPGPAPVAPEALQQDSATLGEGAPSAEVPGAPQQDGPQRVVVEGDGDAAYGATVLDEDDAGVWLLTDDGRQVVVDREDVAAGDVRLVAEPAVVPAAVQEGATGAENAQVAPVPSGMAVPTVPPPAPTLEDRASPTAASGVDVARREEASAPQIEGGIDPETGEVLSVPATGEIAARAAGAVAERGRPAPVQQDARSSLDALPTDELRRWAKVLTDNARSRGWDARSIAARKEVLSIIAARNAEAQSVAPSDQQGEGTDATAIAPGVRVRSDGEAGVDVASETGAGERAGRAGDVAGAGAGQPGAAVPALAGRENVSGAVVAGQQADTLTAPPGTSLQNAQTSAGQIADATPAATKPPARSKGKLAPVARRASGIVDGAVAGDTVTMSHDVEYATGGQTYRVERIDGKGTVHLIGPTGAGTSLSLGALLGAQKQGVTFTRGGEGGGPGKTSGTAVLSEPVQGEPLSGRPAVSDTGATEAAVQTKPAPLKRGDNIGTLTFNGGEAIPNVKIKSISYKKKEATLSYTRDGQQLTVTEPLKRIAGAVNAAKRAGARPDGWAELIDNRVAGDARQARTSNVPHASASTRIPDATGRGDSTAPERGVQTPAQRTAAARKVRERAVSDLNALAEQAERDGKLVGTPPWQGAMEDAKAAAGMGRRASPEEDFVVGWKEGLNNDSPPLSAGSARRKGAAAGRKWAVENGWKDRVPVDVVSFTLPRADESKSGTRMDIANDPQTLRDVAKRVGKLPTDRFFSALADDGPFGPIFNGFTNRPEDAIRKLMEEKRGEVPDAFVHPDLGPIAFVYGNERMGLRHIEERRGTPFIDRIPSILRSGRVETDADGLNRAFIVTDHDPAHVAVLRLDWDGNDKTWLVTSFDDDWGVFADGGGARNQKEAYRTGSPEERIPSSNGQADNSTSLQKKKESRSTQPSEPREGRMLSSRSALHRTLAAGRYGRIIHKLIGDGRIVLHKNASTLPKGAGAVPPGAIQGMIIDRQVHLVASNLTPETALPVLLHEMFHAADGIVDWKRYQNLMSHVGRILHSAEDRAVKGELGGAHRRFWDEALKRVNAAETPMEARAEELAAYAIEHREGAPKGLLNAVDGLVGVVKDWLARKLGVQVGQVTPAQLRAMAVAALRSYGRGVPASPTGGMARYSAAATGASGPSEKQMRNWLSRTASDTLTKSMPALLKTVPLDPLVTEIASHIKGAQSYLGHVSSMDAHRQKWAAAVHDVVQPWLEFIGNNRKVNSRLMEFMHETTLAQVDPSGPFRPTLTKIDQKILDVGKPGTAAYDAALGRKHADERRQKDYDRFRKEWSAMPLEARQIYESVRDQYKAMAEERDAILVANARKSMEIALRSAEKEHAAAIRQIDRDGLTGQKRADAIAEADEALAKARRANARNRATRLTRLRIEFETNRLNGPYFRLARFGEYFVHAKNAAGDTVSFSRHEKLKDQRSEIARLKSEGHSVYHGVMTDNDALKQQVNPQFVADIEQILQGAGVDRSVLDEIWQRYLETSPDMSVRTSQIHRKGTPGYNPDALRAFTDAMAHGAYQNARLKYLMDMNEALKDARDEVKGQEDPVRAGMIVNEIEKRHQFIMNPLNAKWAQLVSTIAFFRYLAWTPAHALLNLTQTPMLGIPILAAYHGTWRGGFGQASKELLRASSDFMSTIHFDRTKRRWSVSGSPRLSADERAAMKAAEESGYIERTQTLDLFGLADQGIATADGMRVMGLRVTPTPQEIDRIKKFASWGAHHTERFNREVTFLAAYRMARRKGETHEQAIDTGHKLGVRTHFNYSNAARPRIMQSDVGKAALVFRNYSVNMLARAAIDIHQSVEGDSPQARKEAKIRFLGVSAMMASMAGISGTWFVGTAMWMAGLFFGGDDGDIEDDAKKWLAKHMGETAASVLWRGAPSVGLGINISSRIGMGDLWFRWPDRDLEGSDWLLHWIGQFAGAGFGATVVDPVWAADLARRGHYWRAIEKATTKQLADAMKTLRFGTEGALTLKGEPIKERFTLWELSSQLAGFAPLDLATRYEQNTSMKNEEAAITSRRRAAVDSFVTAVKDGKSRDAALRKIAEYNRANPDWPITRETLSSSIQTRQRNSARTQGGIVLNPKIERRIRSAAPPRI